jgi:hypothetical protein
VTRVVYACANRAKREEVGIVSKDEISKLFMILTKNNLGLNRS